MSEIVFLVEEDPDGGYTARALSQSIFTQADDLKTLREMVLTFQTTSVNLQLTHDQ